MINPSASGWIDKFFIRLYGSATSHNTDTLYSDARNSGIIYGYVTDVKSLDEKYTKGWTPEEKTKVALLENLYLHFIANSADGNDYKLFIKTATAFYKSIIPDNFALLKKVLPASSLSLQLEGMIDERVQTNETIISRSFSHIITNALLYMDVLAFRAYLKHEAAPEKYLRKMETAVISIALQALNSKPEKSVYDDLLIKLFASSLRYTKLNPSKLLALSAPEVEEFDDEIEKNYLLDIAAMSIWSDGVTEKKEIDFFFNLATRLDIDNSTATESIASFDVFIRLNKKNISYFKYSNPVKHFYDNATQNVVLLIKRNKNRLVKELSNNKDLVLLLTHSTHRSLNDKEKKKVKKQLLEICKTVPSLTIFLLPGGSLLLPLLIKFIPQLLPSMFNENLDTSDTD